MRFQHSLCLLFLALAACKAGGTGYQAAHSRAAPLSDAGRGKAFAQAHCAACHAVERLQRSPNPEAPPFEAIVNRPGLTASTLATWMRDTHNFPQAMNFEIEGDGIEKLAAYMLSLRDGD